MPQKNRHVRISQMPPYLTATPRSPLLRRPRAAAVSGRHRPSVPLPASRLGPGEVHALWPRSTAGEDGGVEGLEGEPAGKAARGGCGVTPDARAVWGTLRWAAGHARAGAGGHPSTASTRALLRDRSAGRCGRHRQMRTQTRPAGGATGGTEVAGSTVPLWSGTPRPGPHPGTLVNTQDALGPLLGRAISSWMAEETEAQTG